MVRKAWQINEYIPLHVVNSIENYCGSVYSTRVGVLGISFKAESDDTRDSPAMKIITILKDRGATVAAYDPYVESDPLSDVLGSSIVILTVDHPEFARIPLRKLAGKRLFYDCTGLFLKKSVFLARQGTRYAVLGRSNQ